MIVQNGMARLSSLQINGRRLDTPTAIPVVKIPNELRFWRIMKKYRAPSCVMINASILASSYRSEIARKSGIHKLLGFNRIVFSDGGGFSKESQSWSQKQIIRFQHEIGADIATTLDYPVTLKAPWFERSRVHRTLLNALEASRLNRDKMLLLASVHAKTRLELQNAIKYLEKHGSFDGYAIGSLIPQRGRVHDIIGLIATARKAVGKKHLHIYGLTGCSLYLLMFYAGADSVDSQGFLLSAANREYYVPWGKSIRRDKFGDKALPCDCRICKRETFRTVFQREKLAIHNFITLQNELQKTRIEISSGRFYEYLERRYQGLPLLHRALRYASRIHQSL